MELLCGLRGLILTKLVYLIVMVRGRDGPLKIKVTIPRALAFKHTFVGEVGI